jgi:DNA-binding NarL/FixJ family response regulator
MARRPALIAAAAAAACAAVAASVTATPALAAVPGAASHPLASSASATLHLFETTYQDQAGDLALAAPGFIEGGADMGLGMAVGTNPSMTMESANKAPRRTVRALGRPGMISEPELTMGSRAPLAVPAQASASPDRCRACGAELLSPGGAQAPSVTLRASIPRRIAAALRLTNLLSARERTVFQLLGAGYDNRSIARELEVSERTVKRHVTVILTKLRLESRLQAGLAALLISSSSADGGH